jgi:hypothetical protein
LPDSGRIIEHYDFLPTYRTLTPAMIREKRHERNPQPVTPFVDEDTFTLKNGILHAGGRDKAGRESKSPEQKHYDYCSGKC